MKNFFLVMSFLFVIMIPTPYVFSYSGLYYGLFTGSNFFPSKHDSKQESSKFGEIIGTVLGYNLSILTFEGEFCYQKSHLKEEKKEEKDKNSIKSRYYMVNSFLNSPWSLIFTPYVGLGVGYKSSHLCKNQSEKSSSSSNFSPYRHFLKSQAAWQAIAGIKCPLFCQIELAIEWRYKNTFKKNYTSQYNSSLFLKYFF